MLNDSLEIAQNLFNIIKLFCGHADFRFMSTDAIKTDNIITGTSLVLLVASLFLLSHDSLIYNWLSSSRKSRPPVASVNPDEKDVRQRGYDDFSWFPLRTTSHVLNDDSIFTGQGAQAYLTFNDGTKVYVKQNSLIKIHVDPKTGAIDLDLKRGGFLIQVNPNSKISVKLDEKHTEVLAQNGIQQEFSSENHLTDPPVMAMSVLPPVERAPAQLIDPAPAPAPAPQVAKNTAKPRAVKRKPVVKTKPVAVAAATPALPSQDVNALKVSAATPEPAPAPEAEATGPQSMFKNITKANSVRSVSTPDDYPFDSLARVAYLYSPGNPSIQGAVSISAWLRKILINSHEEARVRYAGFGVDYNSSLSAPKDSAGAAMSMTTIDGYLKYNFIYGSMYHDKVLGGVGGMQSLTMGPNQSLLLAGGLYYGQPFPAFMDKIFSSIPFFRKEKWLEFQGRYIFMPLTTGYTTSGSYDLNFNSKMFFDNNVYLFTTLGFANYSLTSPSSITTNLQSVSIGTGLGAQF